MPLTFGDVDAERQSILKWLVSTDPSPNHNKACELHESHTGNWFTSSPEYEDWIGGSTRFLWLHGIPGAGKTVLLSYIAESVKKFCQNTAPNDAAYAYYYCYFGRAQDETTHLLRWVINQFCRQSKYIPEEVRNLYHAGVQPSTASLVLALSAVVRCFNRVYLMADALDESLERPNLLNMLAEIAGNDFEFGKVRLLMMSRKELDIERTFENIFQDISLSNPRVEEDIRLYIRNELRNNLTFSRWPGTLTAEIESAVAKGAKGM